MQWSYCTRSRRIERSSDHLGGATGQSRKCKKRAAIMQQRLNGLKTHITQHLTWRAATISFVSYSKQLHLTRSHVTLQQRLFIALLYWDTFSSDCQLTIGSSMSTILLGICLILIPLTWYITHKLNVNITYIIKLFIYISFWNMLLKHIQETHDIRTIRATIINWNDDFEFGSLQLLVCIN